MPTFRLTRHAEADLTNIADYTLRNFGFDKATHYVGQLEECCASLAENPELGRSCDNIRPGLRRFEFGKHVLFYRPEAQGILISRVLHERMLPQRHELDERE